MVRLGLIGCGRIATRVHLHALSRLPGVRLCALAELDPMRRQAAHAMKPDAVALADYADLVKREDLDAVVICLPTDLHAEAAVASFAAGKHVYLEKPIATTLTDGRRVLEAWRSSGKAGAIGFNYRFHPLIGEMRKRLRQGEIGRVVAVRSVFSSVSRDLPDWKARRESGGGALLDLASHHFDLIPYLLEEPISEVSALMRHVRVEEDTAAVQMRLSDGVVAQTFVCMSAIDEDRIEIIGDDGKLTWDRLGSGRLNYTPTQRDASAIGRVVGALEAVFRAPASCLDAARSAAEPSPRFALAAFVEGVRSGRPLEVDLDAGYRSLTVVCAAEESMRSGRTVSVEGAPTVRAPGPATEAALRPLELSDTSRPALSVVVVATGGFRTIRRTVRHLRQQTLADRIELVLVAPDPDSLGDMRPDELAGFRSVRKTCVGAIQNVDVAAGHGIRAATGELVATIEDHAFPDPTWAEAMFAAFAAPGGPWAAVGSMICNANPDSPLSWTNLLIGYGKWYGAVPAGQIDLISQHNVCFRRAALAPFLDALPERMGRAGSLLADLKRSGGRFYFQPMAIVRHVNPSRLGPTAVLRFCGGRLQAATRARSERFSRTKRAVYTAASPLFPLLRLRTMRGKFGEIGPGAWPALLLGLALDAAGQMLGFAAGPGQTAARLAGFEFDRARHVRRGERAMLYDEQNDEPITTDVFSHHSNPQPTGTPARVPEGAGRD